MTKPHPTSSFRTRFNWRLWVVLGALTELFLIYVARWWAPSPVTYFLAVLFLPVMVLTGFWSSKYFKLVQLNLELSRRADQNLQELSHFFETATAVSNLTKLGEDLGTLTLKLAELLDVEMCGFFLYQDGLEALIAPAAPSGMRESRLFNQMRLNQLRFSANASTLIGRVFVTQQPVIVADCLHDIEAGQLLPQTFGYHDLLLVPLGSGGRPLGVLMLANKRNGQFSGNYDVKLAASLGAEVAVSLENTFLFEQTRQQALRLDASMEMLRQVSQALTATTVGPTALLQGVARAVIGVSGATSCLITLTQSGNPAQQAVEVGESADPRLRAGATTPAVPGLVAQVVIEQRPVFSEDVQLDGRFPLDPFAQQSGWRAALGLPMFLEREFVGTVSVYFNDVRAFDATPCGEVRHSLIRGDVCRPAIRIAGIVDRIHPDKDVAGLEDLGPRERKRQEDRVARRDVGNWDSQIVVAVLRHGEIARQCRPAEGTQVDVDDDVIAHPVQLRHSPRRFDLNGVALTVAEGHRVHGEPLVDGVGEQGRRIEAAAEQQHRARHQPRSAWSKSSFRSSMCSSPTETRRRFSGARVPGPSTDARCSTRLSVPPRLVA